MSETTFDMRSSEPSKLAGLLADLASDTTQHLTLSVPRLPKYALRLDANLPFETYAAAVRAANDPTMPGGVNEMQLACTLLVHQCVGVLLDGDDLVDDSGSPVTLHDPVLAGLLHTTRPADTVRALFGRDGDVLAAGNRLVMSAGYGQDATAVPTSAG